MSNSSCYLCGKKVTGMDGIVYSEKGICHLDCSENCNYVGSYNEVTIEKVDCDNIYELSGFELAVFLEKLKDKINELVNIINEKDRQDRRVQ